MQRSTKYTLIGLSIAGIVGITIIAGLFILGVVVYFSSTGVDSVLPTALPAERPADLSISFSANGGMLNRGASIDFDGDTVTLEANEAYDECVLTYQPTTAELDQLYAVLLDNRVDRIGQYEQDIYDRGGYSLSIHWGMDDFVNVSDSGTSFIKSADSGRFNTIQTAIVSLNAKYLALHPEANCAPEAIEMLGY